MKQQSLEHTVVYQNSECSAYSCLVMQALADQCDMFTGAELAGLCREAAITALREDLQVCTFRLLRHLGKWPAGLIHIAMHCKNTKSGMLACPLSTAP